MTQSDTELIWWLCLASLSLPSDQEAEGDSKNLHVIEEAKDNTKNHLDNSQNN